MTTKRTNRRSSPTRSLPTRPTVAEIDLSAIAFNLKGVRARVGSKVKVMAVVKANAYGHGIEAVARFVERSLADYFGVATAEEGVVLREAGIRKPIHIFTLPADSQARLAADFNLEPTICSSDDIRILEKAGQKARKTIPVHLKIETGMNRVGVHKEDLGILLRELGKAKRVEIKGIYTHFANADERDKQFFQAQLNEFREALAFLDQEGVTAELVHCANSAAILDAPESWFSMVRPGVMMYGYYPSKTTTESVPLRPAMQLQTSVAMVKWIEEGETVSYGRRFTALRRTQIATLPVGYADGITRLLTGKASVLLRGKRFPVAGTICMDQLMVDVGDAKVARGDTAVLIGAQNGARQSAWDLAEAIGTIPYEICCAISSRVPRVYHR